MPTDNLQPPRQRWFTRLLKRRQPKTASATLAHNDDRALVLSLSPKRIPSRKQLQYLPRVLTTRDRNWIRSCVTLIIASILTLVGHTLYKHIVIIPADGGTLNEGIVGTPQYINPVLARPYTADAELTHLVFRGLMKVDDKLAVVPDIASSISASADGKVYTVVLRSSQYWSDGTELTADDVQYTYETIADATYQSPLLSVFKNIKVTTTDKHTVVFTLPTALSSFPASLTLGILPKADWQDQTAKAFPLAELNVKPIGNGPYKFQSVTKDRSGNIKAYTFTRNKYYNGTKPHITKITVKVYPDEAGAIDALKSDAIDSLGGFDSSSVAAVKKYRQLSAIDLSQLTGVFFNQKTSVVLKASEVRQALAMTIDRPALIKTADNNIGTPANGPLLPGQPGFSTLARHVDLNVTQAAALLDQNGWKVGTSGIRQKGGRDLAFSLTTVNDPSYVTMAQALVKSWLAIGIKADIKTVDVDRIMKDAIQPRQYDALLYGELTDASADMYPLWHSAQQQDPGFALAIATLKNADTDLEKARATTDPNVYAADLLDFQNIFADSVPAIIISQTQYIYAHEKNLRGITIDRLVAPMNRFDDIASWYTTTTWSWK